MNYQEAALGTMPKPAEPETGRPNERAGSTTGLSSRWRLFYALALLVSVASALVIFPRIGKTPFHGDESDWISGGYYYTNLLKSGDLTWEKWACPECGPWGKINLQLGKWLIGAPLLLDPATRARPYMAHYNFDATVEQNRREGTAPSPDLLPRARTTPAVFGVLCCVLLFAIGFWTYNAWVGLIAVALLLSNSLFLMQSTQAMTDAFYNFFLLAGCLALVALSKTASPKRALLIACLCGVLAGLACSVKVTGILLGGAVFVVVLIDRYRMRKASKSASAWLLAAFSLFSLTTVYALDPVFWPSWQKVHWSEAWGEMGSFAHEVELSKHLPLGRDEAILAAKRYPQLRNLANPLEFPVLFLRWSRSMERQLGRANWHGNRLWLLHRSIFSLGPPLQSPETYSTSINAAAVLYAVCIGAGVFFLLTRRRTLFPGGGDSCLVPLFYLAVNYLLILAFLKLNWNRYYLPTIIAADLMAGIGLYAAGRLAAAYLLVRFAPSQGQLRSGVPDAQS